MSNINPQNERYFTESSSIADVPRARLLNRPSMERVEFESFAIGGYLIKISRIGAAVYDGKEKLIASVGRMTNLFVEPEYRRRGIAEEMIFQWLMKNRDFQASGTSTRTEGGKRAYRRAWERYKAAVEAEGK